ncbi:phage tail protein [Undibacterium fentianense]|uniref:Phage tail protein n=1 Tax=Undibacterium fentianense TaxID=2828728 RepID=A0A941E580_9BURK|nr:tail fiber protein [Undibacterium fentianense]MBR7801816.1 phage tail protein [Undibacterium fentianense]
MADPFVAEIRIFPFNFAPRGWAWCDGQILSISQNTALFSLLGITYGGDGRTSFALPNLSGRAAIGSGQGPGLSERVLGDPVGQSTVTLTSAEIPSHNHTMQINNIAGNSTSPSGAGLAVGARGVPLFAPISGASGTMHASALAEAGGGQPHNNMQPYLTMNFAIAMQGVFPPRT